MTQYTFRSSRPDNWTHPRSYRDASQRYMAHGAVRPMEEPGLFSRMLGLA